MCITKLTDLNSRIVGMSYPACWSAFVSFAPPNTFVMRFRLQTIVAMPISVRHRLTHASTDGDPKMRYLIVAKGCQLCIGAISSLPV